MDQLQMSEKERVAKITGVSGDTLERAVADYHAYLGRGMSQSLALENIRLEYNSKAASPSTTREGDAHEITHKSFKARDDKE